ncbi:hypothetical protein N9E66_03260 [Gammaproteobacteria bacterium]|nr:hypothetical protein [Gammaproteobacteria bacterium]
MEEFIGFGLVSLVVLGLFLGMKKIFNKKKNLFDYDDEIILDNNIVHYGPFSGSLMYPHRKFIFILAFSSSFLSADWTRTIDGWGINSYSNENLVIHKTGEDTSTNFYLEMARPFCITSEPTVTIPIGNSKFSIDSEIEATMIVDRGKPKDIILEVGNIIGESPNFDYVLKIAYFPSIRGGKTFDIKFDSSSSLDDMSFSIAGMSHAIKHSERMCMSGYDFQEPEIQETSLI